MASDNKNDPKDIDDGDYVIGDDIDFDVSEADEVFEESYDSHDTSTVRARKPIGEIGGGKSGAKKLALPALVLVCAVGVGAYMMMNPGLLGGASKVPMRADIPSSMSSPVGDTNTAEMPAVQGAEMPPQPTGLAPVEETQATPPPAEWNAAGADPSVPVDHAAAMPPAMQVVDITAGAPPPSSASAFGEDAAEIPAPPPAADIPPAATDAAAATPVVPAVTPVSEPAPAPEVPAVELPVVADAPAPPAEMPAAPPPAEFPQVQTQQQTTAAPAVPAPVSEEGVVGRGATPSTVPAAVAVAVETPAPAVPAGEDVFFDSHAAVPSGAMAKNVGPRKVDPVMEPGSSFVVVNKTHGAQSQESLLVSANRALKLGRYDAAMEMYDSLYAKNKKDPAILMGRAVAYQKAGRSESAIQMYEELLAVDKNNGNALLNMLGLLRTQYPETALRRLMNLREQYPGNASVAAQIGLIEADLNHPDEALRYLGMAASIEPQNAQHYFNMAIVADRKGDKAQAIKLYEQALETDAVYGGGRSIAREQIYDRLAILRRG